MPEEIADGMSLDQTAVQWHIEQLLRDFAKKHEQITDFSEQWFMREKFDPKLGEVDASGKQVLDNPFAGLEPFQTPLVYLQGQRTIDRLTENDPVIDVLPPKITADMEDKANQIALVMNTWMQEMQERSGEHWGRIMSDGQVRQSYAVMHVRRCEDIWPDFARREGEAPGEYEERVSMGKAKAGPPWQITFPQPVTFACQLSNGPKGGLSKALLSFEVFLRDYEDAFNRSGGIGPSGVEGISARELAEAPIAPGIQSVVGSVTGQVHDTPSFTGIEQRVHVYQLWSEDEYYECVGQGAGGFELRKGFKHDYGQVPFRIVPARVANEIDPVLRWQPYMWPLYQIVPNANRYIMLSLGVAEMTADPVIMQKRKRDKRGPYLADGTTAEQQSGTSLETEIPSDVELQQVNVSFSGVAQGLQWWSEQIDKATPDTGFFELATNTQPGTARVGQSQASVGPKNLLHEQDLALAWTWNLVLGWHARNEEELVAYPRGEDKSLDRSKIVKVDPKDLDLYTVTVHTDPTSSWEKITATDHLRGLLEVGLITEEEFYEEARGSRDPRDQATKVLINNETKPYRVMALRQGLAAKFGSKFVAGLNGEILNVQGQPQNPYDVMAGSGMKPQRQNGTSQAGVPGMVPPQQAGLAQEPLPRMAGGPG